MHGVDLFHAENAALKLFAETISFHEAQHPHLLSVQNVLTTCYVY
jgi:hypothetical protein